MNLKYWASVITIGVMLSACDTNTQPTALPSAVPNQLSQQTGGVSQKGYQVLLVQSVVLVGPNRFAIGILDNGAFVKNANLMFRFYDLTGSSPKVNAPVQATYREGPDGISAMYTAQVSFPSAGTWGVSIAGTTADGKPLDLKAGFNVVAKSAELQVGRKAPLAKSTTLASVGGDFKKLTSAPNPKAEFYQLSLDQALTNGKPTLVLFSTPAFCTSRLCGPDYEVVSQIYSAYGDRMNFIHIEVYKDLPQPDLKKPQFADALYAWGLQSEPWTYILDKSGFVFWRAEGLVTVDELRTALDDMLARS